MSSATGLSSFKASSIKSFDMLVLASASPRREELLRNAGIEFSIHAANISEAYAEGESPRSYAERLAKEKALAVFAQRPNDFILGADTIVVVDGLILGKPRDQQDASRMLSLLSRREHQVITAVCLAGPRTSDIGSQFPVPGFIDVRSESTQVFMTELSAEEIKNYIGTGEPMDKAGAYAIQGRASRWISRIEGDYFNVVGLPVALVYRMLQDHKII
jgi:septum formation protein